MTALIGLAGRYWYIITLAVVLAFAGVQTARLGNAKRDQVNPATQGKWKVEAKRDAKLLTAAVRDLGQCRTNEESLKDSIRQQNAAIDDWKAEAAQREAEATAAARNAQAARLTSERYARALAGTKAATTCPAREAAIAELVKGLPR